MGCRPSKKAREEESKSPNLPPSSTQTTTTTTTTTTGKPSQLTYFTGTHKNWEPSEMYDRYKPYKRRTEKEKKEYAEMVKEIKKGAYVYWHVSSVMVGNYHEAFAHIKGVRHRMTDEEVEQLPELEPDVIDGVPIKWRGVENPFTGYWCKRRPPPVFGPSRDFDDSTTDADYVKGTRNSDEGTL